MAFSPEIEYSFKTFNLKWKLMWCRSRLGVYALVPNNWEELLRYRRQAHSLLYPVGTTVFQSHRTSFLFKRNRTMSFVGLCPWCWTTSHSVVCISQPRGAWASVTGHPQWALWGFIPFAQSGGIKGRHPWTWERGSAPSQPLITWTGHGHLI